MKQCKLEGFGWITCPVRGVWERAIAFIGIELTIVCAILTAVVVAAVLAVIYRRVTPALKMRLNHRKSN